MREPEKQERRTTQPVRQRSSFRESAIRRKAEQTTANQRNSVTALSGREIRHIEDKATFHSFMRDAVFSTLVHREAYNAELTVEKKVAKMDKIEDTQRLITVTADAEKQETLKLFLRWLRNPTNRTYTEQSLRAMKFSQFAYGDGWSTLSEDAKVRAGYRCEVCGRTHNLNTHHKLPAYAELLFAMNQIKSKAEREALMYAQASTRKWNQPNNLIVLCESCHCHIHPHMESKVIVKWTTTEQAELDTLKEMERAGNARRGGAKINDITFERKYVNKANYTGTDGFIDLSQGFAKIENIND